MHSAYAMFCAQRPMCTSWVHTFIHTSILMSGTQAHSRSCPLFGGSRLRVDMSAGMCVDMCVGTFAGMCVEICVDMFVDMCIDMFAGMCVDMCVGMCVACV